MPFVPAPNIVMVELRCLRNNQKIENRWMFNMLGPPASEDLATIAQLVWDWSVANYMPLLSAGVQMVEAVATDMGDQNGEQFTYAPNATTFGAIAGTAFPNETALCISLRSNARGRSARGRSYTLSVCLSQMQGENNVSAAAAEQFRVAFNLLITDAADSLTPMAIVSYRTNNAPRVGGPVYFNVQKAIIVDTIVDSQKRRKPGVGE